MQDLIFLMTMSFQAHGDVIRKVETMSDFLAFIALYLIEKIETEDRLDRGQFLKAEDLLHLFVPFNIFKEAHFFPFTQ